MQDLELGKFSVVTNGDKPAHSASNGSLAAASGKEVAAYAGTGIRGYTTALPFEPLVFTFKDVSYSVPMPEVSGQGRAGARLTEEVRMQMGAWVHVVRAVPCGSGHCCAVLYCGIVWLVDEACGHGFCFLLVNPRPARHLPGWWGLGASAHGGNPA